MKRFCFYDKICISHILTQGLSHLALRQVQRNTLSILGFLGEKTGTTPNLVNVPSPLLSLKKQKKAKKKKKKNSNKSNRAIDNCNDTTLY